MGDAKRAKIAVVGGGVAGASVALLLGELGLEITLFEQKESLLNGPPICHLHAGGNLYREISDAQCLQLLRESIEFVRLYPSAIDLRPTVIALPLRDKGTPKDLYPRLALLQKEYARLTVEDKQNEVLGSVEEYFKLFDKESVAALQKREIVANPKSFEEWMIPVAKMVDLEKVQFPLIMVEEYGINLFKLAATLTLSLQNLSNVELHLETEVQRIASKDELWELSFEKEGVEKSEVFDYLINAAGFQSGQIDDMLGFHRERFVEFKAAYISKFNSAIRMPEVIFQGERGTPQGMAQFTPYPEGYVQLHGMTEEITLFRDGLVKSSPLSAQPKLDKKFIEKIYKGWSASESAMRTKLAIEYVAQFIPSFKSAEVGTKPLYGAQQIPGKDATLRAAEVSFEGERYARCEIVKASSVLAMADAIALRLAGLGYLDDASVAKRDLQHLSSLKEESIVQLSRALAKQRDYPEAMADVLNKS